jgi:hypothetical protein
MRARLVHRVTPDDVGRRISLRHRLPPGSSHATSDVLGVLLAYDDGVLRVETRDGPVDIAEADALASRVVPPPPAPRPRR